MSPDYGSSPRGTESACLEKAYPALSKPLVKPVALASGPDLFHSTFDNPALMADVSQSTNGATAVSTTGSNALLRVVSSSKAAELGSNGPSDKFCQSQKPNTIRTLALIISPDLITP